MNDDGYFDGDLDAGACVLVGQDVSPHGTIDAGTYVVVESMRELETTSARKATSSSVRTSRSAATCTRTVSTATTVRPSTEPPAEYESP
ncbi:hypothetical protein EA472_18365 [Natrarchaeobius oligotrophus]|uniref:Uncharacterized protein n=1 Tax=Natrarchaeobius chitinivorans TaxID=1679083 RepID=A0A3N6NGH4_NATCH|nr:hypothetical protein EA472_18365 [Natrarchaeobius chitinivorans]